MSFPVTLEEINERVSYRLTFDYTAEPRAWHEEILDGPSLPDARAVDDQHRLFPEPSPGTWMTYRDDYSDDAEGAMDYVLSAVVGEAIHEALEWLRVDGHLLIDPHDSMPSGDASAVRRAAEKAVVELMEHIKSRRPALSTSSASAHHTHIHLNLSDLTVSR